MAKKPKPKWKFQIAPSGAETPIKMVLNFTCNPSELGPRPSTASETQGAVAKFKTCREAAEYANLNARYAAGLDELAAANDAHKAAEVKFISDATVSLGDSMAAIKVAEKKCELLKAALVPALRKLELAYEAMTNEGNRKRREAAKAVAEKCAAEFELLSETIDIFNDARATLERGGLLWPPLASIVPAVPVAPVESNGDGYGERPGVKAIPHQGLALSRAGNPWAGNPGERGQLVRMLPNACQPVPQGDDADE